MRKAPIEWAKLYGVVSFAMGDTIYSVYGKNYTDTTCPRCGTWFGKFVRGSKLRPGVIKNQEFGATSKMVNTLLVGWDTLSQRIEI